MNTMQSLSVDWRHIIRWGLLAGVITVFIAAIGMLESFDEREVVDGVFSLGELMLYAPTMLSAYYLADEARKRMPLAGVPGVGLAVGLLAGLPILLLIYISQQTNVRSIFVNITPTLIAFLTQGQENLTTGALMQWGYLTLAGLVAASMLLIPGKIRRSLLTAGFVLLLMGVMSELVALILQQLMDRERISQFFNRQVMLESTALGIFVLALVLALFWNFYGGRVRAQVKALPSSQQRGLEYSGYTGLLIFLLALPWVVGSSLSLTLTNVGLYILMGLGLNIAVGLAGLLDLGYVTNFAVGAYIMGVLTSTGPLGVESKTGVEFVNFWLVIPISILCAMMTGFLLAVPVLRMRGDYLAITTLGFGEIIGKLALSDWLKPIIGGAQGVLAIPSPQLFGITIKDPEDFYYLLLAACAVTVFVSIRLNNSRIGRQWMAVREDEDVAAAMGIDTARSKLLAFTLSAATGGLAGSIFAANVGTVFPNSFTVLISIQALSLIIIGGMGSIPGIVLGALVLIGLPDLLREFDEYRNLFYGALLIFMMLKRPEGLWPSKVRQREIQEREPENRERVDATREDKPSEVVIDTSATI